MDTPLRRAATLPISRLLRAMRGRVFASTCAAGLPVSLRLPHLSRRFTAGTLFDTRRWKAAATNTIIALWDTMMRHGFRHNTQGLVNVLETPCRFNTATTIKRPCVYRAR